MKPVIFCILNLFIGLMVALIRKITTSDGFGGRWLSYLLLGGCGIKIFYSQLSESNSVVGLGGLVLIQLVAVSAGLILGKRLFR